MLTSFLDIFGHFDVGELNALVLILTCHVTLAMHFVFCMKYELLHF